MPDRFTQRVSAQSGQTLVMVMIIFIIMLVICLFLVDVQRVITIKAKSVSAVDSAALVGAEWQRHTLNLIGEINLIKATTALIEDFAGDTADDNYMRIIDKENPQTDIITRVLPQLQRFQAAEANLTQMQVRLSFVGPMLGVGAAQQAAKNNGLNFNGGYCQAVYRHLQRLRTGGAYSADMVSQEIEGYEWKEPYANMLEEVLHIQDGAIYGIAVDPHPNYLNYPRIDPDFLTARALYQAVNTDDWCARVLRDVIYGGLSTNWWEDISIRADSMTFPRESEYLTLGISFTSGAYNEEKEMAISSLLNQPFRENPGELISSLFQDQRDPYTIDNQGNILNPARNEDDGDWKFYAMSRIRWAQFDYSWEDYDDETIGLWSNYLRGGFQDGYAYSGAISYIKAKVPPDTITAQWKNLGKDKPTSANQRRYLAEGEDSLDPLMRQTGHKTELESLKTAEERMESEQGTMYTNAIAKAFGKLELDTGEILTPHSARLILPVFTHSSLVPVSLDQPNGDDLDDDESFMLFLTEYIPALQASGGFDDMQDWLNNSAYGSGLQKYHNALVKLNDPAWREEVRSWLEADTYIDRFGEEQPVLNVHGEQVRNVQNCDFWTGTTGGQRRGPTSLH
ncbi:MAG: Tad domain-containing protein [Victivallales bacterium]|nr:Tad domain-containing protein [Victivallales bacterium]